MTTTTSSRRRSTRAFGLVAVLLLVLAGSAYAAIPGAGGVYKGCVAKTNGVLLGVPHSKGDVRLLDTGEVCRSYEAAVTWNQTGPVGPVGATGATGATGPSGPTGPAGPDNLLHATVHSTGGGLGATLANGDAVSVEQAGVGAYALIFGQVLDGCSASWTNGYDASAESGGIVGNAFGRVVLDDNVAYVGVALGSTGVQINSSFHLLIAC